VKKVGGEERGHDFVRGIPRGGGTNGSKRSSFGKGGCRGRGETNTGGSEDNIVRAENRLVLKKKGCMGERGRRPDTKQGGGSSSMKQRGE